jgi:hypothetical protein
MTANDMQAAMQMMMHALERRKRKRQDGEDEENVDPNPAAPQRTAIEKYH